MSQLFLDPHTPLSTCAETDCEDCPLLGLVHCHFTAMHLLRFLLIAFPPFIVGGIGIVRVNAWLLVPWIGMAISYFGFVEIKVMCSHCPHYAEPSSKTLQCWANYGSPKLWKYTPGPMSQKETIVFFTGLVIIAGYPLLFLIVWGQWLLLVLFMATMLVMGSLMGRLMCVHCMNFACPFNCVSPMRREMFFARNPSIAKAWREPGTE